MDYKEKFKEEFGYDAYAYDENKNGEPRIIGFCQNYVEWLEGRIKDLEHFKDNILQGEQSVDAIEI